MADPDHLSDVALLLLVDDDLPGSDLRTARLHVARCAHCRHRLALLAGVDAWLQGTPRDDADDGREARAARARLASTIARRPRRVPLAMRVPRPGWRVAVMAATLLLVTAMAAELWRARPDAEDAAVARDASVAAGALPIRHLTPGATRPLPAAELCRQIPVAASPIPASVRAQVLRDYGMQAMPEHEYELDYLVTPDLGGSPDPRNLWPEPYGARVWNARVKDELEALLPKLVCEGKVDLATAQQDIATNWIAAYKKYFGTDRPLRLYSMRSLP
jgi:hypothetical protein